MKTITYLAVSGIVFLIVALLHLIRAVSGWQAKIGNFNVPIWLSWLVFVIAAYLSFEAYRLMKK